jgi:hypothetical protein
MLPALFAWVSPPHSANIPIKVASTASRGSRESKRSSPSQGGVRTAAGEEHCGRRLSTPSR